VAHILFVDSPVGAGFSFSRDPKGYYVGEISSSLQLHKFLNKVPYKTLAPFISAA
jgi:carboxypeptidase C (cathepsin A)